MSEVNLVIFAGQSNMNGIGNDGGADLDQRIEFNAAVTGIKYWDIEASSFTDVIDPASNTQTQASAYEINFGQPPKYTDVYRTAAGNFGPELNFARLLKYNDISDTYLFKFAHNGSTVVDLSSAGDKWPQLDLAQGLAVINNWNPGGYAADNQFRLYNRFKAHCEAIIDDIQLAGSSINNVTFIWAQGEQEAFTGQENNSLASGYGQACADLIDAVSGIFSEANSFYSIRSKVNVAFASGTQGDHQYYPNGFYVSDSGADPASVASQVAAMDGVYDAIGRLSATNGSLEPGVIYPKASLGLSPGYYGNKSFSGTENLEAVRQQQEDMDTNTYGPLLDFDDLSGYLLDAGTPGVFGGRIEKLSSPVALPDLSYVSAYHTPIGTGTYAWLPDTSAIVDTTSKNIHYNDYALHVAGNRFFNNWANEVLEESDYTPLPDPNPPPESGEDGPSESAANFRLNLALEYEINMYNN